MLVETLAIGVCGTDRGILAGEYGEAPPGEERLVLGHESIGCVLEAPDGVGMEPGDLVVGVVRRPDPVPCSNCAVGEWDMCRNGQYTEHGKGVAPAGSARAARGATAARAGECGSGTGRDRGRRTVSWPVRRRARARSSSSRS